MFGISSSTRAQLESLEVVTANIMIADEKRKHPSSHAA